jgi:hypothetical protein
MSTPTILAIAQPLSALPPQVPIYSLYYPSYPTERSPSRFILYRTPNETLWEEYLRVNRTFCDMGEDIQRGVIITDVTWPGPWCPPEGYPEGQGPGEAEKRKEKPPVKEVVKGVVEGFFKGVEGVLVVGVMVVGLGVMGLAFVFGICWVVGRLRGKRLGGDDDDEDDDEYVDMEGHWGKGVKRVDGDDEDDDGIPLVEKPRDAKLTAEKYYL